MERVRNAQPAGKGVSPLSGCLPLGRRQYDVKKMPVHWSTLFIAAFLSCLSLSCEARQEEDKSAAAQPGARQSPRTPPAPARGRILFQSQVDGRWQIFVLNLAGGARTRLTRSAADDTYPNFSPAGDWIVFESTRGGAPAIWRMRPDGSAVEELTRKGKECRSPCWGQGGAAIAYDCKKGFRDEIFALDIATRREKRLTNSVWRSILPHWSPDGSSIVFTRNELGWDVFRMKADGSGVLALTSKGGNCRPDWSPDGKRIAYVSDVGDGKGDIWTMDPDGGNKFRLTLDSNTYDYNASWSPDGAWIVYESTTDKRRGPWRLMAIPAAGGEPVRLSPEGVSDRFPDWGP